MLIRLKNLFATLSYMLASHFWDLPLVGDEGGYSVLGLSGCLAMLAALLSTVFSVHVADCWVQQGDCVEMIGPVGSHALASGGGPIVSLGEALAL